MYLYFQALDRDLALAKMRLRLFLFVLAGVSLFACGCAELGTILIKELIRPTLAIPPALNESFWREWVSNPEGPLAAGGVVIASVLAGMLETKRRKADRAA